MENDVSKDLKGREPGCLDHQRPTSLEGTNCVSSLTYSSTISPHLSRLPGTLSPIYLPIPGAVLCLSLSLLFSFIVSSGRPVASPSPPSAPHPILLFHTFPAGPQLRPHPIHERLHCLLLVHRFFHLRRLALSSFFPSLLPISPTNLHGRRGQFSCNGLKSPSRLYAYPPQPFPFELGLVLT